MIRTPDGIEIDTKRYTITRGLMELNLSCTRGQRRYEAHVIFKVTKHLLLAGHSTKDVMFDIIYGSREDGGPDQGPKCLEVHFYHAKARWARLRLELRREKVAGKTYYWLHAL